MKNNQAGGIVSFVVVGLVLAGLLGGGLYLSKQQGRQARDTDTTSPQVAVNEEKSETGSSKEGSETPAKTPEPATSKPATPEKPAPQPSQPAAPAPATGGTDRVATTGPSDAIPATGPVETMAIILALGTLTFAGYRFVDARRGFLRSALRR